MDRATKSALISGIPIALVAAIAAVVGAFFAKEGVDREMDVKMVEIAVGILSQPPTESIAPARAWAVDVISHYSTDVPINANVRSALVQFQSIPPGGFWRSGDIRSLPDIIDEIKRYSTTNK